MQELINAISKGNKRAFSQLVGVTPTVIENIVGTRQGKPGYELLEKIAFAIENINVDWLLTGRGYMLRDSKTSEESKLGVTPNATPSSPAEESIIYKMYKEKDEENKALIRENGRLEERIRQLESQDKEPDPHSIMNEALETFTDKPSGDYGEGYSPMKPRTTSKRSSAGKI